MPGVLALGKTSVRPHFRNENDNWKQDGTALAERFSPGSLHGIFSVLGKMMLFFQALKAGGAKLFSIATLLILYIFTC